MTTRSFATRKVDAASLRKGKGLGVGGDVSPLSSSPVSASPVAPASAVSSSSPSPAPVPVTATATATPTTATTTTAAATTPTSTPTMAREGVPLPSSSLSASQSAPRMTLSNLVVSEGKDTHKGDPGRESGVTPQQQAQQPRSAEVVAIPNKDAKDQGVPKSNTSAQNAMLDVLKGIEEDAEPPCPFEQIFASEAVAKDALNGSLFLFPEDETALIRHNKQFRTVESADLTSVPSSLPLFVRDGVSLYRAPWEVLQRKFEDAGAVQAVAPINPDSLPSVEYPVFSKTPFAVEVDDPLRLELLDIEKTKLQGGPPRSRIFDLYRGVPALSPVRTPSVRPYEEVFGRCILMKAEDLRFKLGEVEPFFCRASIYELSSERTVRLSEDFSFEVNTAPLEAMLKGNPGFSRRVDDVATASRSCIFNVLSTSTDVHLVLRFEKIYQDGMKAATGTYVKFDPAKTKDVSKFKALAQKACSSIPFKAPFGYAILPLFNEKEEFVGNKNIKYLQVFRQAITSGEVGEEALSRVFADPKQTSTTKKMKPIPTIFTCTLEDVTESFHEMPERVDASMNLCLPLANQGEVVKPPVREIQAFPRVPVAVPHLHYINNFYVRPESFAFPKGVSLPIVVKIALLDDDKEAGTGTPISCIYGGFKESKFVPEFVTPVAYNPGKTGQWYVEAKIALPLLVTRKHHVLFTISEVDVSGGKLNTKLVGYAFMPLLQQGQFVATRQQLAIHPTLRNGYLGAVTLDTLDGGRHLLSVETCLISSVYTQVGPMYQVLRSIGDPFEVNSEPLKMVHTFASIMNAENADIIKFLPLLFTHLFRLVCTTAGTQAFVLLISVLSRLQEGGEAEYALTAFAEHVFMHPNFVTPAGDVWIHEELTNHWFEVARSQTGKEAAEKVLRSARFLFQVIFKSMVYQISARGTTSSKTRSDRFSKQFTRNLEGVLVLCAWHVQQRSAGGPNLLAKSVNRDVALFLRDLFSIMDRGIVFRMIKSVLGGMAPSGSSDLPLVELKLDFLRVITEYKYWVALNLPLPMDLSNATDIARAFEKQHFLASTFLNQVTSYFGHPEQSVRLKTIVTLAQLFERHEFDPSYVNQPVAKQRIANIYFPFILIVSDHISSFKKGMEFGERRLLFSCVLWALKNCDPNLLRQWWRRETSKRLVAFFDVLGQVLKTFEFRPKETLEQMLASSNNVLQADSTKSVLESFYARRGAQSGPGGKMATRRFASTRGAARSGPDTSSEPETALSIQQYEYNENREANLNTEASMVILNVVEDFLLLFESVFQQNISKHFGLMDKFLKLLLEFMKRQQSLAFINMYFRLVRKFVDRFPAFLFQFKAENNMNPCGPLTLTLVKQLDTAALPIRSQASATLYLMMKRNFESRGNFARMRVETMAALTKLLDNKGIQDDTFYRKGLKAILAYSQQDFPDSKDHFYVALRELMDRLFRLLEYSAQLLRETKDPEMAADLYHSIAHDYKNAPELRVVWLETLSQRHTDNECHAEAALCWIHIAALVAQYLHIKMGANSPIAGAAAFVRISPNVMVEASFYNQESVSDSESIYDEGSFNEAVLITTLRRAVELMEKAELYEGACEVYHLLLPIFEKARDYASLAAAHGDLQRIYQSILKANAEESRIFATYYRVAFYGKEFEHLDGEEFVYRERGLAKLRAISDRLTAIYGPKVGGADKINIVQQSGELDVTTLGPGCHIQLTRINPYFEGREDSARVTYYERNTSVQQFMFEAPFLKNPSKPGKTVADHPKDQWKRKTIITCHVAAPDMRKRLLVASKTHVEMTPIEVAIAEIESRVLAIRAETSKKPPNSKTLQPMIQGSVKIMVNEGPAKMLEEFLGSNCKSYPERDVARLAHAFFDFLEASEQAILVDKDIAPPEMRAFHQELAIGYQETYAQIMPHCQPHLSAVPHKKRKKKRLTKISNSMLNANAVPPEKIVL